MNVQPTNLQQLHDVIVSTWNRIPEECFEHLIKSMPQRILEANGDSYTVIKRCTVPNKVV